MHTINTVRTRIAIAIAAAVLTAACGQKEEARPGVPQPAPVEGQGMNTPASPLPERPAPDVAKDAAPELPKPGQVNNHSSPEFKGGGTPDSK